jgi:hypothetical protein
MVMAVQLETADATWLKEVTVHEVPRFSAGAAMAPRAVRSVRPAEASIFAGDCRERLGWGEGGEREKKEETFGEERVHACSSGFIRSGREC